MRRLLRACLPILAALALTAACAGGDPPAGPGSQVEPSNAAQPTAHQGKLLSKVWYNDMPSAEYTYGNDGKPVSQKRFHPVTGEFWTEFVVISVDGAGRITEGETDDGSTRERVTYEYDSSGRRIAVRYRSSAGKLLDEIEYSYDGTTVTQKIKDRAGRSRRMIYSLDGDGNVVSQRWISGKDDQTHRFSDFDGHPNPMLLTAGLASDYPISTQNHGYSVNFAGCESRYKNTYDPDGLLIQTDVTGCKVKHRYRYEYTSL